MASQLATFGAGCFWGVELDFRVVAGVIDALVGYEGGSTLNPTYHDVCTGDTGHAEVIQVVFDPELVSYDHLLDVFFQLHDPTTLNRQGPDIGDQYRSVVFYHDQQQQAAVEAKIATLSASGKFRLPIVTQVERAQTFYRAEEYHQRYLEKRGQKSCAIH